MTELPLALGLVHGSLGRVVWGIDHPFLWLRL